MVVGVQLIKASTSMGPSMDLIRLQKTKCSVKGGIWGSWLSTLCCQNKLLPKWVERRRLAEALCRLQWVCIETLTPGMAGALFSALATCRTGLKYLGLPNGWTGSLRPGLVARSLRRVQELYIEGLDPVNTTILLNALSEDVGQLKSLHVGRNVSYQNMIEMETVAKAFNQVEVLYLDLGGSAGFRDYLCLKATLRRLATPGESNLKYLRLKNFCTFGLFQIPTCGLQQSLSFASSTPLPHLYSTSPACSSTSTTLWEGQRTSMGLKASWKCWSQCLERGRTR